MTSYLIVSSIFMLLTGVMWTKKYILNFTIKVLFLVLGGWGGVLALMSLGFVLKTN